MVFATAKTYTAVDPAVKEQWEVTFKEKFLDSYRVQKAWEYMNDEQTFSTVNNPYLEDANESFQSLIRKATAGKKTTAAGSTSGLEGLAAVANVLGNYEAAGNPIGTNFIDFKTKWRRFGLLTGFNIHSVVPTMFTKEQSTERGIVSRYFPWNWDAALDEKIARTRATVADPRYATDLIGPPEPNRFGAGIYGNQGTTDYGGTNGYQGYPVQWVNMRRGIQVDSRTTSDESIFNKLKQNEPYGHFIGPVNREYNRIILEDSATVTKIDAVRQELHTKAVSLNTGVQSPAGTTYTNTTAWTGILPAMFFPTPATGDPVWLGKTYDTGADTSKDPDDDTPIWGEGGPPLPNTVRIIETLPLDMWSNPHDQSPGAMVPDGSDFTTAAWFESHALAAANPYGPQVWGQPLIAHQPFRENDFEAIRNDSNAVAAKALTTNKSASKAWKAMADEFFGDSGNSFQLADHLYTRYIDGDENKALWGDSDSSSDTYRRNFAIAIETILDFFGAGQVEKPTAIEERDESHLDTIAGGDETEFSEEQQKKILSYKALKPFDFQCFLMENIDFLSTFQEQKVASVDGAYEHLITLKGTPGNLVSQINHGGKSAEVEQILNLTPTVQGLLVPYIKLYRVDYDPKHRSRIIKQQEIPIPNFLDPSDIAQLTGKGSGRYKGFGLKSFNWKLDGVQPATVDNNISANLSFYFQSVNDLFQGSLAAGQRIPNPLDLLISPRTMKKILPDGRPDGIEPSPSSSEARCKLVEDNIHQQYDGASFRIKVVAGWATPPNIGELMPDSEPDEILALQRAIDDSRVSLFLQQTRHNLNFKQDGTVELSIDYIAALTGLLTSQSADILGARQEEMEARLKKIQATIKEIERDGVESSEKKQLKAALKAKNDLINEDKLKKYKRFLSALYGRDTENQDVSRSPRLYTVQVNPSELIQPRLGEIVDPEWRAQNALRKMSPNADTRGYKLWRQDQLGEGVGANTDLLSQVTEAIQEKHQIDKKLSDKISEQFKSDWEGTLGANEDIYIPYFYLGDLIDSIVANNQDIFNAKGTSHPNYMTFLGSVDIINPLLIFMAKNAQEVACADKINDAELINNLRKKGYIFSTNPSSEGGGAIKMRLNIGSIPISLDAFNIWFKDNVIKKGKNTYYLAHFLKDICGLITESLGKTCAGDNVVNQIRFDTSVVHYKRRTGIDRGSNIAVSKLARAKGRLNPGNDVPPEGTEPKDRKKWGAISGLVLYSTDARPESRNGAYLIDLNDGIYHNYLGSSAGLIKNINFNRVDQPYLREANIQKHGHLGAQQLRELYSAEMDMVGNNLFKNGQYTYIWPTLISSDDKFAKLLGLGGYFLITGVNHTISSTGYNVKVSALQEGLKLGGGNVAKAEAFEDVEPADPPPNLNLELEPEPRQRTLPVGGEWAGGAGAAMAEAKANRAGREVGRLLAEASAPEPKRDSGATGTQENSSANDAINRYKEDAAAKKKKADDIFERGFGSL